MQFLDHVWVECQGDAEQNMVKCENIFFFSSGHFSQH